MDIILYNSSSVITSFMAQAGISTSSGSCSINTNAVRYGRHFAGKKPVSVCKIHQALKIFKLTFFHQLFHISKSRTEICTSITVKFQAVHILLQFLCTGDLYIRMHLLITLDNVYIYLLEKIPAVA